MRDKYLLHLMRNKYPLHIINGKVRVVDSLSNLLYIYKYREIITFDMNKSFNHSKSRTPYPCTLKTLDVAKLR